MLKNLKINENKLEVKQNLYDFSGNLLVNTIREVNDTINYLMVFGHNHALTYFVNAYGSIFIDNVPTCGIHGSSCDVSSWSEWTPEKAEHLFFYYPKLWLT